MCELALAQLFATFDVSVRDSEVYACCIDATGLSKRYVNIVVQNKHGGTKQNNERSGYIRAMAKIAFILRSHVQAAFSCLSNVY